jgi:hypothetical protein
MIQAFKPEPSIMRHELTDFEWAACSSAWAPDADRRAESLIYQAMERAILHVYLQTHPSLCHASTLPGLVGAIGQGIPVAALCFGME